MQLAQQIANAQGARTPSAQRRSCVTLGTFDGVHRGHQSLLKSVTQHARADDLQPVALVFRVPPRSIINPSLRTPLLCNLSERIELIRAQGIEHVYIINFDDDIRTMSAANFVNELRQILNMDTLMLGEGAKIGNDQMPIAELAAAPQANTHFITVPMARQADTPISSSTIRQALSHGDVKTAHKMLGRPFHRGGTVIPGQGRATKLGIPTANIAWTRDIVIPAPGIYASWTTIADESVWPAATYIGDNPTLGGASAAFETHLLDNFNGELYGETINVSFVEYIREDIHFPNVDHLEAQLKQDINQVSDLLSNATPARYPIP